MAVDPRQLTSRLDAWLAEARTAWPGVALDPASFAAYIAARVRSGEDADLAALHAVDLYLTAACAAGDPHVIAAFERRYLATLDAVLRATGLADDQIADVRQDLTRKLLVADGGPPRIAEFSGRADLKTWVRTAAVRAAIDVLRRRRPDRPAFDDEDELAALPALGDDPELLHLKQRYRGELREAMMTSLAQLSARDRLLLKYAYLDGLSTAQIGGLHQVHKTTAARWIADAREALAEATYQALVARLGVTRSELRSIARLVESQVELSLHRLLA